MALVKCKECGTEISDKAEACPKCGAKPPKTSGCTVLLALGFAFFFIAVFIAQTKSPVPSNPPVNPAPSAKTPSDPKTETASLFCEKLEVKKFSWSMEGFGNVAVIESLTVKNNGNTPCKDITLGVSFLAASGTQVGNLKYTIYDSIPAGKSKTFHNINLGFVNKQAHEARVRIAMAMISPNEKEKP